MDELHETAEAYYEITDGKIKQDAEHFFNSLDQNRDGKVSKHEYLAHMNGSNDARMAKMANPSFFKSLNRDGSGELGFKDVMTLYYILLSGRRFCDGCGEFMKGLFFTCDQCFNDSGNTFNVCPICFKNREYVHKHKKFMDNYVLLETKRMRAIDEKQEAAAAAAAAEEEQKRMNMTFNSQDPFGQPYYTSSQYGKAVPCYVTAQPFSPNPCTQLVVCSVDKKKRNWKGKLKSFAASAAGPNCSIM